MHAFPSSVFRDYILGYRFKPVGSIGFKEGRIVDDDFENEDFDIQMGVCLLDFFVKCLHKQRHIVSVFSPLIAKQLFHSVETPLNIFHYFMLIDIIHFKLMFHVYVRGRESHLT